MVVLVLSVLGLCLGSFVNALVWRLHEQSRVRSLKSPAKKGKAKDYDLKASDLSIIQGRSMCPNCHHTLAWYDLLPVVSWLSLRGRCRYCHRHISIQYPIVEIATALLILLSYYYWPSFNKGNFNIQSTVLFGFWLVILTGLVALFVYDLKWLKLPSRIIYPLQALAALQVLVIAVFYHGGTSVVINGALGAVIVAGLFFSLFYVSKGQWIGDGDYRLGVIIGLLAGSLAKGLLLLFLASLLGSLVSLPLMLTHRANRNSRIPFGPFLIAATFIVVLFGQSLINWYNRILVI